MRSSLLGLSYRTQVRNESLVARAYECGNLSSFENCTSSESALGRFRTIKLASRPSACAPSKVGTLEDTRRIS